MLIRCGYELMLNCPRPTTMGCLDFDGRPMLQFRRLVVTSDAGLLAHRELDDALGLTTTAGEMLADTRTGKNGRHSLVGI